MIRYKVNDEHLSAEQFISFSKQVWEGADDLEKNERCAVKNHQYHGV